MIDKVERSGRQQARLIEDLLDVSRVVAGRLHMEFEPIELSPVIEAALDVLRPAAEAKGVRLESTLAANVGLVAGDPDRLQQVCSNLLSNAIKFTPSGGRVEARLERDGTEARIVVSDTGTGISPEFLPHVFEHFAQFENGRSAGGLGLAIVHHVVQLHGGTIEVESGGVGLGARFTVRLPLLVGDEGKTQVAS